MKLAEFDVAALKDKSCAAIEYALSYAKQKGASAAESAVGCGHGISATVRLGEIETVEYEDNQSFDITVYFGAKRGNASSSDLSRESIAESVDAACDIARYVCEDDCAGLVDRDALARETPDLSLDHPWSGGLDRVLEIAMQCEEAARVVPRIINSEGASVDTRRQVGAYGNTHDFLAAYPSTIHAMSCIAVAGDGDAMQRDYWFASRRNPTRLSTPQAVGKRAAECAVARLGARKLKSCKATVLFTPRTARFLIGNFLGAISGGSLYRGTSFLMDSLDTQVFPSWLQLDEEPHLPEGLSSAAFDAEGAATRPRRIVADGVVRGYILDTYSARKLGFKTTGNAGGARNPILRGGEVPYDDLVAKMDNGLIVGELIGNGVNATTGDYSQGVAGFWVENGKVAYPVEEVTLAGNLRDMFMSIAGLGDDLDEESNIRCGSVLIENMTIAGL